jgi:hypothetical protein
LEEDRIAAFFKSALPLVLDEPDTVNWYGLQMGPSTFGIFDTLKLRKVEKHILKVKLQKL